MRFLVVIIFLFNGFLSAQVAFKCPPKVEYDYFTKFEHFTTTKGLSNNDVTAIIQDNTGFLWFGTTDGLNRFDGYKFTVYKVNPKDTNSLSCNEITSLAVDKYNNIWIGTRNGLNKFNPSENKFTRYTYDENKRNTITNNWVRALYAGKDNYLYLETTDGTFHKYDIEKNIFKYYKHTGGENSNYSMHQIYEDKEGIIWAGGANSKLIKYEKKADKIKEFDFGACSFLEDDFGNFYLANQGGIIHLMDKNTFQRKEIPLTSIYSVIEDSDKNIWFGGYGSGAVRYSVKENKMTIYKYVPNNPYSIISDGIFKIYQDRSGVIWFATHLGLSKLSFTKYKFNHYFHIDNCNKTATSNRITAAIQENDSILWLGTWDSGLDKYNRQTGIFTNYNFDPNNKNSISSKKVSGIALDRNNNDLWISVWNGWDGAINKFNRNNETFTRYNFGDPWLSDVLVTRSGNVWSVGWGFGAGFSLLDKTKKEPTLHFNNSCVPLSINFLKKDGSNLLWFDFGFFDLEKNQFFNFKFLYDNIQHTPYYIYKQRAKYKTPNNIIIDKPTYEISELVEVIKGDENYTWLAFRNGLVLKYDCKAQTFSPFNIKDNIHCACVGINKNFWIAGKEFLYSFSYEKNKPEIILKNSDIKQIYEDQSGFLWIATSNQIIKFNKTTSITKVVANISNAVILPYDDDKRLMFFSKEKILVKNKSTDETVENNAEDLWKTLGDAAINKVKFFRDEILFIGTSNGLFIYNFITRKTSKYKYSPKDRTGLQGNDIRAIEIDKRGKIWLGTEKGLILFDYAKNIFVNYFNIEENCISSVCTTCALEDNEGNVWLGTSINGLNKINFKTNKIDHYCFLPYDSTSLSDKMVSCLFQDSRKNIWVGTDNGLNRLDSLHKKFKRFTTSNGFPSDKISGILEDNRGFLWISTANGLVKFDPVTEKIIYIFTKKEGLQDNEFSSACCKLKSGELLFGGFNGFNIFHPDKIQFNKLSPQIGISAFYINDSLSNIPNDFRSIELSYFQNNISFEFTAFDYNDPENLKYAYIQIGRAHV